MSVIVLGNGFQLTYVTYCVSKRVSVIVCQLLCKQMGVSYNVPVIVLANGSQLICVSYYVSKCASANMSQAELAEHQGGREWERKY